MRRTSVMTLGFVLIFVGAQLHLVETYVLTPRFTNFLAENAPVAQAQPVLPNENNTNYDSPYYQAAYSNPVGTVPQLAAPVLTGPKAISPPKWLCWPVLFLGGVVFLHGLSRRHD